MSDESDMWNRFFHGSKYEWKWLKRGQLAKSVSAEEFSEHQKRLEAARGDDPPRASSQIRSAVPRIGRWPDVA